MATVTLESPESVFSALHAHPQELCREIRVVPEAVYQEVRTGEGRDTVAYKK